MQKTDGGTKMGEDGQKIKISSYKILRSQFWQGKVQHGDYS